jgi:HAD superfamily hydrolase (TIGR01509 family)
LTTPAAPHSESGATDRLDAVIFDFDGVLANSEPLHRRAWEGLLARRGITAAEADYEWSIGRRDIQFAGLLVDKFGLTDTAAGLQDEKRSTYLDDLRNRGEMREGARELVLAAADTYRIGLASSAKRDAVDIVLERFEISPLFKTIVTNEDVSEFKPRPEPYLLCARRLGVEPRRCVAFEDSPSGVHAARAAGMRVIAVTGTSPPKRLADADEVTDGLADTARLLSVIASMTPRPAQV